MLARTAFLPIILALLCTSHISRVSAFGTNSFLAASLTRTNAHTLSRGACTTIKQPCKRLRAAQQVAHEQENLKEEGMQHSHLPELCVFDLDACFWDQEMFEMPAIPEKKVMGDLNGRGTGVLSVMSGGHPISLHKGSLQALQDHADGKYPGMKVCFASSADTPFAEKIGRASLKMLEVLPGMTVWDLVVGRDWGGKDINQIGRQPPLSSDKSRTHFPRIRDLTGVRYDKMLFFDDCNWGDHCANVAQNCKEKDTNMGPATLRTPAGLRLKEWEEGLKVYAAHASALSAKS